MEENLTSGSEKEESGLYFGDIVKLDVLLVDIWKAFKKLWWLGVLLIASFSLLAYYGCKKQYVPKYRAQASFSISTFNSVSASSNAGSFSSYYNSSLAEQLSKTFGFVINSATMKQILMNELGVNGLNGVITAKNDVANAPLFTITVESTSAKDAYDILCAVIDNYPRLAQYVIGETSMSVYSPAELPEKPYNAFSYKKTVVLAAAAGAVVSFLIFAFYALTRSTVKKREDIKEKLNLVCLGEVPWVSVKKRNSEAKNFVTMSRQNADFSEAFRYLKRRVLKRLDAQGKKVLAVTSAVPGEGKSTVSYNLAFSIAQSGKRVALLDADFARMSIQSYLGVSLLTRGITDYLEGECAAEEIATKTELENFKIFFAGSKKVKRIQRESFERLFDYLRENFDYVIMDSAPCGVVSQTAPVINMADKTLFVVRQDHASVSKIKKALSYVFDLGGTVVGVVFNGVKFGFTGYKGNYYGSSYYGYGRKYGYYGKKYGYYGKKYGYSSRRGEKHGYGSGGYGRGYGYGYGYGYGNGENRVNENLTDERKEKDEN